MMPYIVMAVILVGMCLSAWLVWHWDRQDRRNRKH
jgi:Flp pilus assembly protein TadB